VGKVQDHLGKQKNPATQSVGESNQAREKRLNVYHHVMSQSPATSSMGQ